MARNKSGKNQPQNNQLRIIGGTWRGRKLSFPDVEGLRPSGDRVRETVFNWLNFYLPGARCLDLFAGSGALGFEALSRGAEKLTMVEKHPAAANSLRQSKQTLGAEMLLVEADALQWLKSCSDQFDLVFLDPPFAQDLLQPAIDLLEKQELLSDEALVYIETDARQVPQIPGNWQLEKEKVAGNVAYRLYQKS